MARVKGVSSKRLARRIVRLARQIPTREVDSIGNERTDGLQELGRYYLRPNQRIEIVSGMPQRQTDITHAHEIAHSIVGRDEQTAERIATRAVAQMTERQLRELARRISSERIS